MTETLLETLVGFLPALMLFVAIVALVMFIRSGRRQAVKFQTEQVALFKHQNDLLERIAGALEQKKSQ